MLTRLARAWEMVTIGCSLVWQSALDIRKVGLRAAAMMLYTELTSRKLLRWFGPRQEGGLLALHLKGYRHPLYFRHGTTDLSVIRQVFCHEEYACVVGIDPMGFIIDCGANIGCTSFYLLNRFPSAFVVAVEPDSGNFAVCERNLESFRDRVLLLRNGIWPREEPLRVVEGTRPGATGEWALEVRPCKPGEEAHTDGISIPTILARTDKEAIDLLKVDIEGAERFLFAEETDEWLARTRNIVIELHGDDCDAVFRKSLSSAEYSEKYRGELLLCSSIRWKAAYP